MTKLTAYMRHAEKVTAEQQCQAPRCHRENALTIKGLRLCDRHWEKRCKLQDERGLAFLQAEGVIGVTR